MPQWTTFKWAGQTFAVVSQAAPSSASGPVLTPAEREVMTLLLAGKSNGEIARQRKTAVRTVANQVASLFRKFGVGSRAALAARVAS